MSLSAFSFDRRHLLGVGAGLAAAAFAPAAFSRPRAGAAFDWTLHRPEEVGMSRAGLEGVRAAVQRHIDAGEQTGAVTAIARHGKLVWYEAQGVRDPETGAPMRRDDIFRMMSSSKCITATAVMMMADAGRLSIDDKVSRFIPSFANPRVVEPPPGWEKTLADPKRKAQAVAEAKFRPASREITIKDLLTHTSGLLSSGEGLAPGAGTLVNDYPLNFNTPLADYIPRLGGAALDFDPGTKWRYSPLAGMDTLLYVVQLVSGQPADVFLRERIFEPLDMRDTFFNAPPSKRDRVLALYERKGGSWRPARGLVGYEPVKYFSGAGGLLSTVHDYLQFEEMLRNRGELNGRRILTPESVALMSTNQVGPKFADWIPAFTAGAGFGLGMRVVLDPKASGTGRSLGAFGWGGAYGTESWVDPTLDLTACYFVQQPVRPALTDFEHAVGKAVVA